VQVQVAAFRAGQLRPVGGLGLVAVAAMDTPSAAIGDAPDLLHVQVHHVAGPASGDLPGLAVTVSVVIDEPALAESELGRMSTHGPAVDHESDVGQFVGDPLGDHFCSRRHAST
jgi:hypothetical protein